MTDNNWNDKKVEELLDKMPRIQDHRPKSEVLARLKQDKRIGEQQRKKTVKWLPAVVTVAALLLLSILLPTMLRNNEFADSGKESMMRNGKAEMSALDESMENEVMQDQNSVTAAADDSVTMFLEDGNKIYHSAVYPEDIADSTVFHMGLAGPALSIPITFVIPNDQIEVDFDGLRPTSFDFYEKYASRVDEEGLGFNEYHPYLGELTVEGNTIVLTLPKGHGYDIASGAITTFFATLQDTFFGFSDISFRNEDGSAVEFDGAGEPSEPMELTNGHNSFNYYVFKNSDGQEFLSPNFSLPYETLSAALNDMKIKPNDVYLPSIPKYINFDVVEEDGLAIVKFKEPLDLNSMDPKETSQMIDGILLTGASFGIQMQFENIVQSEWNGFNFNKPLPIPVGPNSMPLLLK